MLDLSLPTRRITVMDMRIISLTVHQAQVLLVNKMRPEDIFPVPLCTVKAI